MTRKAAVMGWPVAHSLSPRLHGFWLRQYGIDGVYEHYPVEPEKLGEALKRLQAGGFCGVNLTVPHKELALPMMAETETLAQRIGAVNTVTVRADGSLSGHNTDAYGFTQNLVAGGYKPDGRPAAILGAGGAARSAVIALLDAGVKEVRVSNRTLQRAQDLAQNCGAAVRVFVWDDPAFLDGVGLLANATSLGMKSQPPLQLDLSSLPRDAFVTDIVYAPLMTGLLETADARGNPVIDGLGMLLHQARPAFKLFFGADPEVTPSLRDYVLERQS